MSNRTLARRIPTTTVIPTSISPDGRLRMFPFGPAPAAGSWMPYTVKYYKLSLDSSNGLTFTYPLSGSAPWKDVATYQGLLRKAALGQITAADVPPLTVPQSAPDLIVGYPCYIILELDRSWNWYFTPDVAAIASSIDCSTKYQGLEHYGAAGNGPYDLPPGQAQQTPNEKCYVLTFAVTHCAPKAAGVSDACNLCVQFDNGSGSIIPMIIDPDIKNNGGDND
jgi:hypothetical protein